LKEEAEAAVEATEAEEVVAEATEAAVAAAAVSAQGEDPKQESNRIDILEFSLLKEKKNFWLLETWFLGKAFMEKKELILR
jgi:hypothetical protein